MHFQSLIRVIVLLSITWSFTACTSTEQAISRESVDSVLVMMKEYKEMGDRTWNKQLLGILEKGYQSGTSKQRIEYAFVSFLKSDVSSDAKNVILYHLGPIASEQSIEALFELLTKDVHFDAALYALSFVREEKIDQQLFDFISNVDGKKSSAIINTLGDRANPKIVMSLSTLLDQNPVLRPFVLAALGNIPTQESAQILSDFMSKQQGGPKWKVANQLIQVANMLSQDDVDVIPYFEKAYHPDAPATVLFGSLRGLVIAGVDPLDKMVEVFKKGNERQIQGIMPLIRELNQLPTKSFVSEGTGILMGRSKSAFFIALADRGDDRVKDIAIQLTQSDDETEQITGLKILLRLGSTDEILLLANSAAESAGEARQLARKCLNSTPGTSFDQKIVEAAADAVGRVKEELILAIGHRKVIQAQEFLIETMSDEDARIRIATMKALAMLGKPDIIPELLNNTGHFVAAEKSQFIRTITQLASFIEEMDRREDPIATALSIADTPERRALLIEVLGHIANEDAFKIIVPLMSDGDQNVQSTAITTLSDWPTDRPLVSMVAFFNSQDSDEMKLLTLRGVERLTNISDSLSSEERAKLLISTLDACKTDDERKIVLSGLGKTGSLITFEAAIKLVSSEEVGSEAEAAILQNIRNIDRDDFSAQIKQYLKSAQEKSSNKNFKKEIDKWLSEVS